MSVQPEPVPGDGRVRDGVTNPFKLERIPWQTDYGGRLNTEQVGSLFQEEGKGDLFCDAPTQLRLLGPLTFELSLPTGACVRCMISMEQKLQSMGYGWCVDLLCAPAQRPASPLRLKVLSEPPRAATAESAIAQYLKTAVSSCLVKRFE